MEEFRNIFRQNRESIQDTLAIADQTEIPAPEIQRAKLNLEDTASFYRSKLIYLLMSLSSVIVLAISLPSGVADFLSFSISGGLQILVAVILCGLAFASGIAQTSAVDVVLTSDGTIARVIVERRDTFKIVGSLAIGAIAIFLLYLLHGGREIIQSPLPFTLGVVCLTSAFIGGRHLLVSISSWRAYTSYAITMLASVMLQISAALCSFAAVLFSMINPTLEGLSYPVRIFSRRPN